MSKSDRMRATAMAAERWGVNVEIMRYRSDGDLYIERPIMVRGKVFALSSTGVHAPDYAGLIEAMYAYDLKERQFQAKEWILAAFDAAAENYDVRMPVQQLQAWIQFGSER